MAAKFREIYPDATRDTVKRKINILRTNYRKELKKVLAGGHKPNLWYYHEFSFLAGLEEFGMGPPEPEINTDFVSLVQPKMPLNYSTSSSSSVTNCDDQIRSVPKFENSSGGEEDSYQQQCRVQSGRDRSPLPQHFWEQSGEYQAVGFNVGAKLQKMSAEQQIYAELLLNKVLARGLLGTLSSRTDLTQE